jgi:MYXO-CTERM domain-containing protein
VRLAAIFVLASAGSAGAAGLTDFSSHAPPDLVMPNAGGTFIDPVFGTRLTRVTDASDGTLCVNAYAYWPAFNLDDTRLLLACDDEARLYRFDGATLTRDGTLRGTDGPPVQFEGASWSGSQPDVIYGLDGMKLWRLDVSRRGAAGATMLKDFSSLFTYPFTLAQLQMSADDQVFTFHSRDPSSGARKDAVVWDRASDTTYVYDRGTWELDETKLDKLGRYCLIDGGSANPGFRIWDFRRGPTAIDDFMAHNEADKPGGHEDTGRTLLVNSDGWQTGLIVRRWDAPHGADNLLNIVQYRRPDDTLNWTIADHVSLRTDDESFAVGSTYGGDGTWGAFDSEIYLAYTNGTGFVRLAHTRSKLAASDPNVRYWAEPRAVVDHQGHFVIFSSDLGSATRVDVMLLQIPPELWPRIGPQPDAGVDAGPGDGDAGRADAGTPGGGGSGCGCRTTPVGHGGWLVAALVLGLVWRTRRKRQG